ncbi:hypothetical protein [Stutzerimonas zhaodongensis]|uniref:hypothetical protein n=1 Tax=Stutzerimonas TaxID=2901164 RepID=UPI00389093BE
MEAERYASHVIGPKTVTVTSETTPTDTINRADGICVANARFIRPFDLGEHTFFQKRSIVNQLTGSPNRTLPTIRQVSLAKSSKPAAGNRYRPSFTQVIARYDSQ